MVKGSTSKILAFNGSHRAEKGSTDIALRQFLKGADAPCEIIYPAKEKIAACEGCGKCLITTPGVCMFNDAMGPIMAKMEEADLLVFASPVYFDGMTSHMKKMFERLRPTYSDTFAFRDGRTFHLRHRQKEQKAVLLFTAGNPERDSFDSMRRVFLRILASMGADAVGEFDFPASHFLVAHRELLTEQLHALASAGESFMREGSIPEALLTAGNKSYIEDPEAAVQGITRMLQELRAKGASLRD